MSTKPGQAVEEPLLRIGELSRRTGVGVDALRAWERRYGVVEPLRSSGGYRLYSAADLERVRAMRTLVEEGISPAEAAASARRGRPASGTSARGGVLPESLAAELYDALAGFDDARVHAILDRALASFSLDTFAQGVVLPTLREIGSRWQGGRLGIDQEHFASHVLRGRLLGLARGWTSGTGPLALLACPGGEQHDLGLIVFGLTLRARGWRIALLGADTPAEVLAASAGRMNPDLVVVSAVDPARFRDEAAALSRLATDWPVVLGGAGASEALARGLGAAPLTGGPVEAAHAVARQASATARGI